MVNKDFHFILDMGNALMYNIQQKCTRLAYALRLAFNAHYGQLQSSSYYDDDGDYR